MIKETTLSSLKEKFSIKVVRDAVIKSAGFLDATYGDGNFVFLNEEKYIPSLLNNPNISAVFTTDKIAEQIECDKIGIVVSHNPEKLFFEVHNKLAESGFYGEDIKNSISRTANIADNVYVAPKNVIIGENVVIEPNVTILEHVKIGNNCYIGAGTVLGSRIFKYYRDEYVTIHMNQVGWVDIRDNVEIISNACIEQAIIDNTIIGENTMVNSLVNVGHGVKIGKGVAISTGSVIAGSTEVGDGVWIGLNATIKPKLHIGDKAYICMGAVVSKDVGPGEKVSGNFAVEHAKNMANVKRIASTQI
ncbi:MAG: UDP-3-O-(3-hydroxymyristoyl)glucosamine N-acyltransferase [Lachnospiraceae bacterium]|nr:UDP-3-O-(3-hydroxymyristoyl)glucosamine N-acyltransferase [Lachnospiraceae bacterium]